MDIAKRIDYIDDPADSFEEYVEKAKKYGFRCVFADLGEYGTGCRLLEGTDIILAGAIDFPEGRLSLSEKLDCFAAYADRGFTEIDYVLDQRAVEERDFSAIEREMGSVADFCRSRGIIDKVIVEMPKLDGDEMAKRRVCQVAREVRPAFMKTSSGRPYRASLADVRLMKEILGDEVRIKAAGGIRNYQQARAFLDAGADVLGATAGIEIVEEAASAA